jgi:NTP pyrophosphatase (non-canonical NTP hydrolase)
MNINLEEMAFAIHSNAIDKGFWEPNTPDNHTVFYLKQLAMIHSEVSEVLEAIRKEKGESVVVEEMADVLIRLLDLWSGMQRDGAVSTTITDALMQKVSINKDRPKMHGVLA